jgi:hypothetical protein
MTPNCNQFGRRLADALGEGPSSSTIARQRDRLVRSVNLAPLERKTGIVHRRVVALAFAAAALALVFFGIRWSHTQQTIHATWGGHSVYGPAVFEATAAHPQSLDFSDGSQLLLEPDTRASLVHLSNGLAELTLEDGHILASIRKHTGINWSIAVGPYRIRVVGTRFTVDWDRERRQLRVAVREGRVRVSGGDLPSDGLVLDAGTMLERGFAPERAEPAAPIEGVTPVEVSEAPAMGSTSPSVRDPTKSLNEPGATASTSIVSGPTWNELAKRGNYKEAVSLAEKLGFDTLVNGLNEDNLLLLANAARYSGDAARAHLAQLKLRERFAGHRGAVLAAFYLARSALDVEHRPEAAAHWFETFLSESPRGDLAALARANLMSLWLNMGQRDKARQVARDYLSYHPEGAQAAQARSLLQSSTR